MYQSPVIVANTLSLAASSRKRARSEAKWGEALGERSGQDLRGASESALDLLLQPATSGLEHVGELAAELLQARSVRLQPGAQAFLRVESHLVTEPLQAPGKVLPRQQQVGGRRAGPRQADAVAKL